MRPLALSALILLALTSVSVSQGALRSEDNNANAVAARTELEHARAAQERKKQAELDAAYKDALKRTPAPATPADPWATVRPANSSATNR